MSKCIRQGDVILVPRKTAIPTDAVEQDKCILALGEVTGHSHQIPVGAKLFTFDDKKYLQIVGEVATLQHEEHSALEIPYVEYGYDVIIQREYDDKDEWRQVRD